MIRRAGGGSLPECKAALAELLDLYEQPIRRLIARRLGVRRQEVDEILLDFVGLKWIHDDAFLLNADPARGRFRDLLHASIRNFVSNWIRDRVRQRRREEAYAAERPTAHEDLDPADRAAFDASFARRVIDLAVERFRKACHESERKDLWIVFDGRILGPILRGEPPVEYEALAGQVGAKSPKQVMNLLVTAKRAFVKALQAVVEGYEDLGKVEMEIEDLMRVLSGKCPDG